MRIKITLSADRSAIIDFNYQHQIQALIYGFLFTSNPDYSRWLHEQGFVYKKDKRFKFFVFSGILFHGPIKIIRSDNANHANNFNNSNGGFSFKASPSNHFTFSFQIASPVDLFIQHLVDGIFTEGQAVRLGRQTFNVYQVETLPDTLNHLNDLNGLNSLNLCPLESPIFIKKPMPQGQQDVFLYPGDEGYEEFLRQNLIHKYETLYGKPFSSDGEHLKFAFYPIAGKPIKQFTVFSTGLDGSVRPINIKGTLQPFIVTGHKALIRIGLECGFGQNNSMGCGYVEAVQTT
ncbi:MAG: CRISPR repeat RNA endoribonuclease Cas6 [Candidatus Jettenia ecosi]|uniref:CRISPR repeat RNA endoribonuclease Cas6 n=1 Tax=Candidatus Jettenia ecosi TaxID=2494326 RepID=A0A533QF29_9BACT|nr:MAG: CRISPR repeat RNA endoribonuclease Cas6 [Candidatus Jettenia ecosi]